MHITYRKKIIEENNYNLLEYVFFCIVLDDTVRKVTGPNTDKSKSLSGVSSCGI